MTVDTAQKTGEQNDFTVFQVWGKAGGKIYLVDMVRGKFEAPELTRRAIAFWNKHAAEDPVKLGHLRQMKVEDKASGTGLIQELTNRGGIPVAGIERTKDRYTRILDLLGYIEAGLVVLPEGAPWVS